MKRGLWVSVLILGFFGVVARAQVEVSPGVARISLIHGEVSTQRGDTGDWGAAALNQPVVAGDKVSTGDRSRAEVQLDHANILRLGNNAQANLSTLTRTNIQVQVGQGLAYYTVFKDSEAQVEIDTPNVAVRPTSKEGVYRIEVSNGETQVIVRKGSADISTPQGSTRVEKGQSAIVRGTADEAEYRLAGAPSKDSWDSWNNERDGVIRNARSWGRTNRYYVGSEDLDAYGNWVNVPDYGYVWQPVVNVGWAPYQAGRWLWEPYWGWTWVSYDRWGWAPYHYGRWFLYGGAWSWWPGPVYPAYRPFWAPAYVSFFGFGGNWGVGVGFGFGGGFGFGSVGWLPIGPCDRFYPWWGGYRSHFNVVNVTNITNITNITNVHRGFGGVAPLHGGTRFSNVELAATNARVRGAISTVPANQFGTGRVAPTAVSHEAFRGGRMMTGNLPIVPTRETLSATNRAAGPSSMMRGGQQQRFFTRQQPAAAPQPFDRQAAQVQDAIQRSGQFAPIRPGAQNAPASTARPAASVTGTGTTAPATRNVEAGRNAANPDSRHGSWQRFGTQDAQNRPVTVPSTQQARPMASPSAQPSQSVQATQPRSTAPADSGRYGWHPFSQANSGQNAPQVTPSGPQSGRSQMRSTDVTSAPAPRATAAPSRSDGWQRFTPQPSAPPAGRGSSPMYQERAPTRSMGEAPAARVYSQGERSGGYSGGSNTYRPPLNMRQPIVTPRAERSVQPSYRGGGYSGGGGGARSSGGGSHGSSGQSHQSSSGGRSK